VARRPQPKCGLRGNVGGSNPNLYIELLRVPVMKGECISVAEQAVGQGQILGSIPSPVSEQVGSRQLGNWTQKVV
jgi:hypothetical protein